MSATTGPRSSIEEEMGARDKNAQKIKNQIILIRFCSQGRGSVV